MYDDMTTCNNLGPMKYFSRFLFVFSLSLAGASYASKQTADEEFTILPHITCKDLSIAPEKLTPEQFRELRTKGETRHGSYTISVSDPVTFNKNLPNRFRFYSGSDSGITSKISLAKHSQVIIGEGLEACLKLAYTGADTYGGTLYYPLQIKLAAVADLSACNPFDTYAYLDAHASPLGAHDFYNDSSTFPLSRNNTFLQLAGLYDGDFVRQTMGRSTHRLNECLKTYLLIAAQQEGEEIYKMSHEERNFRATELFTLYLQRFNLHPLLSKKGILPEQVYVALFQDMIERIFENGGYSIHSWDQKKIEETGRDAVFANADLLTAPDLVLPVLVKVAAFKEKKGRISSLKTPLLFKRPTDFVALMLEYRTQQLRPTFALTEESHETVSPGLSNKDIAWLIFRWGAIDPVERHIVGLGTELAGVMLQDAFPMGGKICKGLVFMSHVLGRKSVADLCVDVSNGDLRTRTLAMEGVQSEGSLKALDKSAECLIGLLPFGGIGYTGVTTIVRLAGFQSPVHLLFWQRGMVDTEDRALSATSGILRAGVKSVVPGGALLLGAGDGIAWYLGKKTLTHAAYSYVQEKRSNSSKEEKRL